MSTSRGEFLEIREVERPHRCYPPLHDGEGNELGLGTIWECECGNIWAVSTVIGQITNWKRVTFWRDPFTWHYVRKLKKQKAEEKI